MSTPLAALSSYIHPLHTSHHPKAPDAASSSKGVSFTEVYSFPPAGWIYSNLFIEISSQIGTPYRIPKGHTPPGGNPVRSSTWSLAIILGFV